MSLEHSPARAGNQSTAAAAPAPSKELEPLDLIWGAAEIGRIINKPTRAVFHLLEAGHLPARNISGQWVSSRRQLQAALEA
jgi:hypothetical protein